MMMPSKARGPVGRVGILGTTLLAMIVVVTPLALWVSWTEWMFVGVIVIGVAAAALYCLLDRVEARVPRGAPDSPGTITRLDDEVVAELSSLQPFVYHNRLTAESRLRSVLDRVRGALGGKR